ncbi:MAG TPA: hypothetical protein VM260_12625, partial [Pirellula sp.]|nr:hypothetical protein [Pirellula sp.]
MASHRNPSSDWSRGRGFRYGRGWKGVIHRNRRGEEKVTDIESGIVPVVRNLDLDRLLLTMSVGAAGSNQFLKLRFASMLFMKPMSCHIVIAYCTVLGLVAVLLVVPWTIVAAEEPISDNAKSKQQSGAGEFVSYQHGKLTLRGRGGPLVWNNIDEKIKTFERDEDGRDLKQVGTVEALSKLQAGMAVRVNVEKAEIYFGADEQTHGTFVSYKNGKLTLIGRAEELGDSFTKKYGTTLSPQIDPKTPVFESVDG